MVDMVKRKREYRVTIGRGEYVAPDAGYGSPCRWDRKHARVWTNRREAQREARRWPTGKVVAD